MIIFDRIIRSIQRTGGASILFNELASRMLRDGITYTEFGYNTEDVGRPHYTNVRSRPLERYRDVLLPASAPFRVDAIFHSTCYRLPVRWKGGIVTTVHDFTYELVIKGVPALLHSWQKNRSVMASDLIICVSNNTRNDLLKFIPNVDENKIIVVQNGASDSFSPNPSASIKPYVLYVGQRVAYKNFRALALAMKELSELELVCVGGGAFDTGEIAFLDDILPNRYRHMGYVSESELNFAYNEALCFVYPSLYEGFGIPVVESMKAGCPVIALNRSSIPEVAGDAALLIDESSPSAIASAIRQLRDSSVRAACVEAGFRQSMQFSWEKCYQGTLEAYRKIGAL